MDLIDLHFLRREKWLTNSKVVVPGFEFADHDFLRKERMEELLTAEQVQELGWMLRTEN